MATYRTGGDVDAFCTRCKLDLGHTILAMVGTSIARVRCNTCGGDHVYRGQKGVKEPGRAPAAAPRASASAGSGSGGSKRATKAEKEVISFDQLLAERDQDGAIPYSIRRTFAVDQVVSHPTFGMGFVSAVRGDKVDITFRSEVKTLVHGRGGEAPAERPSFQPPSSGSSSGSADKPPADSGDLQRS